MKRSGTLLVLLSTALLCAPAAAKASLPVVYSSLAADAYGATHTNGPPPGANDFGCHPSPSHPYPVVLVPGTLESMAYNWFTLSPLLKNAGYCVFALNYGQSASHEVGFPGAVPAGATGDIPTAAEQLANFVTEVLSSTGAEKVDIVGHSQGGMMPRYYLRFLGGAANVHELVGLSPSNHGTTVDGLTDLIDLIPNGGGRDGLGAVCGTSCEQQLVGSPFMTQLNAGGDTVDGVTYTVIETEYDEVVTPYQSAFLSGPTVNDILLQNQCAEDFSEHLATPFDHIALQDVLNALDPTSAKQPVCSPVAPILGG